MDLATAGIAEMGEAQQAIIAAAYAADLSRGK
jgi:hypothetical protein